MVTKARFKKVKTIAVHNGSFHSDEVFAIAILKLINPTFKVIRTRDEDKLKSVDMRIDVGGVYNEKTFDFDHHQESFSEIRENKIPYAACGLIWKHFGNILVKTDDELQFVDDKIIQQIDADDNGIRVYDSKDISPYTLQHVMGTFAPSWSDKTADFDAGFNRAVKFAIGVIDSEIKRAKSQTKIKELLVKAIKKSNGDYIVLSKSCPWKNYIIENSSAKYVIYKGASENWHIQGVPISRDSFDTRKPFPKNWAGLRDVELQEITGVKSAIFCHKNLFLSVCETKADAIKLVEIALEK